jgi:hypothetical protein
MRIRISAAACVSKSWSFLHRVHDDPVVQNKITYSHEATHPRFVSSELLVDVSIWPIATLPQEFMSAMPPKVDKPEPT